MDTIIVTGTLGTGYAVNRDDIHYAHPSSGFSLVYTLGGVTMGTSVESVGTNQVIAKTDSKPKTKLENLNADQMKAVTDALANAGNSADLSASFNEMADLDVTLTIKVVPTPSDAVAGEQARVSFPANSNGAAPDTFVANSTVEILVFGDRLNESDFQYSFRLILAHELAHLLRDSSGSFLSDTGSGTTTYTREQEIHDAIFGSTASAPNSGVLASYDASSYSVVLTATNGNDYIVAEEFTAAYGTHDNTIYTGNGFDVIVSGTGSDHIVANGSGKKLIYDFGASYDVVTVSWLGSLAEVVSTKVGMDLYVTSAYSSYSVIEDPTAIILSGWFYSNGYDTIEFMTTANGEYYSFNENLDAYGNWVGPIYVEPSSTASVSGDSAVEASRTFDGYLETSDSLQHHEGSWLGLMLRGLAPGAPAGDAEIDNRAFFEEHDALEVYDYASGPSYMGGDIAVLLL